MLAAPPGDGLRVAREHFHEYIKPVLVAGALDWEVIEGRKEGEVRAGLAEKIRKLRKRNGENPVAEDESEVDVEEAIRAVRQGMGCQEWEGVRGDLVVGRHTWKEYVRGLHEGWLGPMNSQPSLFPVPPEISAGVPSSTVSNVFPGDQQETQEQTPKLEEGSTVAEGVNSSKIDGETEKKTPEDKAKSPPKPTPSPPYITPSDYPSSGAASSIPSEFPPSIALPLPHVLGFLSTPKRIYRFLNRRHLADDTGASVAALVLASHSRPFDHAAEFASSVDPEDASPSSTVPEGAVAPTQDVWEQEKVLRDAEGEWHKSAWTANEEGDDRERPWKEDMVIDARIGQRMRVFELPEGTAVKAEELEEAKRKESEGPLTILKNWAGFGPKERKGWEMGLEGGEDD